MLDYLIIILIALTAMLAFLAIRAAEAAHDAVSAMRQELAELHNAMTGDLEADPFMEELAEMVGHKVMERIWLDRENVRKDQLAFLGDTVPHPMPSPDGPTMAVWSPQGVNEQGEEVGEYVSPDKGYIARRVADAEEELQRRARIARALEGEGVFQTPAAEQNKYPPAEVDGEVGPVIAALEKGAELVPDEAALKGIWNHVHRLSDDEEQAPEGR
jgi:hypothetical protein